MVYWRRSYGNFYFLLLWCLWVDGWPFSPRVSGIIILFLLRQIYKINSSILHCWSFISHYLRMLTLPLQIWSQGKLLLRWCHLGRIWGKEDHLFLRRFSCFYCFITNGLCIHSLRHLLLSICLHVGQQSHRLQLMSSHPNNHLNLSLWICQFPRVRGFGSQARKLDQFFWLRDLQENEWWQSQVLLHQPKLEEVPLADLRE